MGYDDGECIQCRLVRDGGNVDAKKRGNLYLSCLHDFSSKSGVVDGRLVQVLKEKMGYGTSNCYLCGQGCKIWVDASICDECLPEENETDYDAMFREYREIDLDDSVFDRLRKLALQEGLLDAISTGIVKPSTPSITALIATFFSIQKTMAPSLFKS